MKLEEATARPFNFPRIECSNLPVGHSVFSFVTYRLYMCICSLSDILETNYSIHEKALIEKRKEILEEENYFIKKK